MKRKFHLLIQISFLIIIYTFYENIIYCQEKPSDTAQTKIIALDQGCKLVLDTTINPTDSLSIMIINGIHNLMPRIQKLIPADSITINIAISSVNILPAFGMGGRSINNGIEFYIDPRNPNFSVKLLLRSLVHESCHVSRLRMPGWQLTLLECMITEGLADHFAIEVLGGEKAPWSKALTDEEIIKCMIQVKPILRLRHESWNAEFNEKYFNPWMLFGRKGDDPIPGWTGYSIGWRIVENYLKAHPEAKASSLVLTSPEVIASLTPELYK
jgi:uncharacterized protein YjaZ